MSFRNICAKNENILVIMDVRRFVMEGCEKGRMKEMRTDEGDEDE